MLSSALIVGMLTRLAGRDGSNVGPDRKSVFLFDGDSLVDASPSARRLLIHLGTRESDRESLVDLLERRFPGLSARLLDLNGDGRFRVKGRNRDGVVDAEYWDGLLRLTLLPDTEASAAQIDGLTFDALQEELETLRGIGEDSPQLIWKLNDSGDVTWANRAYLKLAERVSDADEDAPSMWPSTCLFAQESDASDPTIPTVRRVTLKIPGEADCRSYEVTRLRRGCEFIQFGIDVTEIVAAEQTRRKFVQVLTKTFAQLAIGLAIFDRDRRLVMFNPAFHDLTGLPVQFLSARPQVQTVLDRLRDGNMLPEPKDYASWREQVAALEAAAVKGTYCETWSLPGGQTYRVTGRPHPDGAVAFLFEDISAEISLTRHFRAELETAQSVLDTMEEAISVFSASGAKLMQNRAYATFWDTTDDALTETSISQEIERWKSRSAPTPIWPDLRDFVGAFGERAEWSDRIRLSDGRALSCRFSPLPGGATLVGFRSEEPGVITIKSGIAETDMDTEALSVAQTTAHSADTAKPASGQARGG